MGNASRRWARYSSTSDDDLQAGLRVGGSAVRGNAACRVPRNVIAVMVPAPLQPLGQIERVGGVWGGPAALLKPLPLILYLENNKVIVAVRRRRGIVDFNYPADDDKVAQS